MLNIFTYYLGIFLIRKNKTYYRRGKKKVNSKYTSLSFYFLRNKIKLRIMFYVFII